MDKRYKIYGQESIDPNAIDQFYGAMKMDYVKQGALMPDAHKGYTLPIGGVVACEDVIVPSYIGFDIGCGMSAIKTTFRKDRVQEFSKEIFMDIYETIPVGFKHNDKPVTWRNYSNIMKSDVLDKMFHERGGFKQLGTLGGGNHFIEIGWDMYGDGSVWIIVHSGSRNVGHATATHYMKRASYLHTGVDKAREGHYWLPVYEGEGSAYQCDMNFCLEFALENRSILVERVCKVVSAYDGKGEADWDTLINRNHNHAELNNKLGLWVHRKGATHAEDGMMGVIPGNMRDGSFIVKGKGCEDSLFSSSHGAGRVLGRKAAKEALKIEDFKQVMEGVTAKVTEGTKDESPMAYKNIFDVMKEQKDLVEVVAHIKPLVNIKG